jgi:hypothetical protein
VAVKATALPIAAACIVAPLLVAGARRRPAGALAAVTGFAVAFAASGVWIVFHHNCVKYGHPLGGPEIRAVVQADASLRTKRVHAARAALTLLEPPYLGAALAQELTNRIKPAAVALGSEERLRDERPQEWPFTFEWTLDASPKRFSLGGLLCLAALLAAPVWAARSLARVRGWFSDGIPAKDFVIALSLAFFAVLVFKLRWQKGGPERFWTGAFAIGAPAAIAAFRLGVRPAGAWALVFLAGWAAYGPLSDAAGWMRHKQVYRNVILDPSSTPLGILAKETPKGARMLWIAPAGTSEYGLQRRSDGRISYLAAWGPKPWDPEVFAATVQAKGLDFVAVSTAPKRQYFDQPRIDYRTIRAGLDRSGLARLVAKDEHFFLYRVVAPSAESAPATASKR